MSFTLTHRALETLIKIAIDGLLLSKGVTPSSFVNLVFSQPRSSKKILHFALQHISQKHLSHLDLGDTSSDEKVSAAANIIKQLTLDDETRRNILIDWCASSSGAGLGDGIGIRRAVIAALSQDRDAITAVLEKSLAQFGDELYIKHAAILQQDGKIRLSRPVRPEGLTVSSPYSDIAPRRWLCAQAFAHQANSAHASRLIHDHHLQQDRLKPSQGAVPRSSCWRIPLGSY